MPHVLSSNGRIQGLKSRQVLRPFSLYFVASLASLSAALFLHVPRWEGIRLTAPYPGLSVPVVRYLQACRPFNSRCRWRLFAFCLPVLSVGLRMPRVSAAWIRSDPADHTTAVCVHAETLASFVLSVVPITRFVSGLVKCVLGPCRHDGITKSVMVSCASKSLLGVHALTETVVVYALVESKCVMLGFPATCNDKPWSALLEVRNVCDIYFQDKARQRQARYRVSTSVT